MMKILKRGTPPQNKTYRATCRTCFSVLKFDQHEAKYVADQRDGDFLKIDCPICGAAITVTP